MFRYFFKQRIHADLAIVFKRELLAEQEINKNLRQKIGEILEESVQGTGCVAAILKRGIDYYDPSKQDYATQVAYRSRAQDVLKNETFLNEIRHLEADWITYCAKEAQDFASVRDMRVSISALQLILHRLETVPDPHAPADESDNFSAV